MFFSLRGYEQISKNVIYLTKQLIDNINTKI